MFHPETDETLAAEARAARRYCAHFDYEWFKLPRRYSLEGVFYGDDRMAWAEIKWRPNYTMAEISNLGGYMLSLSKWMAAEELCRVSGRPFVLIVLDRDEVIHRAVFAAPFEKLPIEIGGRRDRGDPEDLEPCVMIPAERFKPLQAKVIELKEALT